MEVRELKSNKIYKAVQWLGDNEDDVELFLGDSYAGVRHNIEKVGVNIGDTVKWLENGSYIVYVNYTFKTFDSNSFKKEFELLV